DLFLATGWVVGPALTAATAGCVVVAGRGATPTVIGAGIVAGCVAAGFFGGGLVSRTTSSQLLHTTAAIAAPSTIAITPPAISGGLLLRSASGSTFACGILGPTDPR